MGDRLWHLARGEDTRRVKPERAVKSISKETTFHDNTDDTDILDGHLWRLSEQVSARAKARDLAGRVVTMKVKRADFKTLTRRHALSDPTQMADRIYREARALLDATDRLGSVRLIGVGISDLVSGDGADRGGDLLDPGATRRMNAERATDAIRARYGQDAIRKGRALR